MPRETIETFIIYTIKEVKNFTKKVMWYSLTGNILGHMMFKKGKTFLILWRKQTDEMCTNYIH